MLGRDCLISDCLADDDDRRIGWGWGKSYNIVLSKGYKVKERATQI